MELDLHGKNLFQARVALRSALARAGSADYRLCVIHGYRGGSVIKDMVMEEAKGHPKVIRLETGQNPGQTILVLREY